MNSAQLILQATAVHKSYEQGGSNLHILKGIDLSVSHGDAICILGPSGAGKSTLLHILGGLDRPSSGSVHFRGRDLAQMKDDALADFRNQSIGFVFQFHHLLSEFTALENVLMPARVRGKVSAENYDYAQKLMHMLGVSHRLDHFPSELSGGEKQRVAIARALLLKPELLLADEPTGNLDSENERIIQDLFFDLKQQMGLTLIVVTHDRRFAERFSHVRCMQDGIWVEETLNR